MPIYAYRCEACGHAQDVLQKLSDPVLSTCPACGAERFVKQVTAAGFQLKGSGWYVTDFRNGNAGAAKKPDAADGASAKPDGGTEAARSEGGKADGGKAEGAATPAAAPAAAAPAPAPAASGG